MEGMLSGHQFISEDAHSPHVGFFGTVWQFAQQLWTHVARGTAVRFDSLAAQTAERKCEVYEHDLALLVDQHVVSLDVSVRHADLVAVLQCQRDVLHHLFRLVFGHRSSLFEPLRQSFSFEILEYQVSLSYTVLRLRSTRKFHRSL